MFFNTQSQALRSRSAFNWRGNSITKVEEEDYDAERYGAQGMTDY